MRTLFISDIHAGPDSVFNVFAGQVALPNAIGALAGQGPLHLVINGDAFDFLMNDDELRLDATQAAKQAKAIVAGSDGKALMGVVKSVIEGAGRVTIRSGNHDLELGLSAVREAIRDELGSQLASAIEFSHANDMTVELGGARVTVAHGEMCDDFNRYRHDDVTDLAAFQYPPGSTLVKAVMNPAKAAGMRFVDLLKPDVEGAVLAALAVEPGRVRALAQEPFRDMVSRVLRRRRGHLYDLTEEQGLSGPGALSRLELDDLEQLDAFIAHGDVEGLAGLDDLRSAFWARVLRAALYTVAIAHRRIAADQGKAFFSYEPSESDWAEAAAHYRPGIHAVVLGHTHAARFGVRKGVTLVNTGTWMYLMALPQPDQPLDSWVKLLEDLRADKKLEARAKGRLIERFHGALLHDSGVGPCLSLLEFDKNGNVIDKRERLLCCPPPRSASPRNVISELASPGTPPEPDLAKGSPQYVVDFERRVQRLDDELEHWAAKSGRRKGDVVTPAQHLHMLVESARRLVEDARDTFKVANQEPAGMARAARLLVEAESTWEVYRAIDGQRRGVNGVALEWAESIVLDGYKTVLAAAEAAGFSPTPESRPPLPLVYLQAWTSPAISKRGARLTSPGLRNLPATIPFPVVMVPPDHLSCPWYLSLLLHEVGHEVDIDLKLSAPLDAALSAVENASRRECWRQYLAELIADTVGWYLGGPRFYDTLRDVVEPLLGVNGGWEPEAVHPPVLLRYAYLEALCAREGIPISSEVAGLTTRHPQARVFAGDLSNVVRAVLDTPLPEVGGTTLRSLLPSPTADGAGWMRLPGRCYPTSGGVAGAVETFERLALTLPPCSWQLGERYRQFLSEWVPRLAPPHADPVTRFKAPPLALLVDYDRIAFVGATNGQLLPMMEEANRLREGRKWREIDVFFLDDAGLAGLATAERPVSLLREERDGALKGLRERLPGVAEKWAVWRYGEPYQFMSFWTKEQNGQAVKRRVHTSANIWGSNLRKAPAVDYVDEGGGAECRELEVYFAGLGALKKRAATERLEGSVGEVSMESGRLPD